MLHAAHAVLMKLMLTVPQVVRALAVALAAAPAPAPALRKRRRRENGGRSSWNEVPRPVAEAGAASLRVGCLAAAWSRLALLPAGSTHFNAPKVHPPHFITCSLTAAVYYGLQSLQCHNFTRTDWWHSSQSVHCMSCGLAVRYTQAAKAPASRTQEPVHCHRARRGSHADPNSYVVCTQVAIHVVQVDCLRRQLQALTRVYSCTRT